LWAADQQVGKILNATTHFENGTAQVKNQSRCEKFGGAKRDRNADLFNLTIPYAATLTSFATKTDLAELVAMTAYALALAFDVVNDLHVDCNHCGSLTEKG
jgi:hypothetical protein